MKEVYQKRKNPSLGDENRIFSRGHEVVALENLGGLPHGWFLEDPKALTELTTIRLSLKMVYRTPLL